MTENTDVVVMCGRHAGVVVANRPTPCQSSSDTPLGCSGSLAQSNAATGRCEVRTNPVTAVSDRRPQPRRSWIRHLLLAVSLVVVTLSVVGMHQLSVGHDVATGPTSSSDGHATSVRHSNPGDEAPPLAMAERAADHPTAGMTSGALGGGCPDCADHQMAFGSCLLALTLLVLSWLLTPPRLRHLPPFLLPRLAPTMAGPDPGRLVPALSLTELSVRRT